MIYYFDDYKNLPFDTLSSILPKDRAERFEQLKIKRDKENCAVAYLMLKYALKQRGVEGFESETAGNGKPYLKDINIHFNISHCKDGVIVAVSDSEIGCDIQSLTAVSDGVMKRAYSDEEISAVRSDSDFTRLWTLKESAAKCDGTGVAALKKYSFIERENNFEKYDKKFSTFTIGNKFISVCGDEFYNEIKILTTEELL